jgi:hypothetical protein
MSLKLQPATSAWDEQIVALFTDLDVTIDPRFWERAFSPEAPEGTTSTPLIVVENDELLVGYAAARPLELFVETEFVPAQVLHDFVLRPGDHAKDAGAMLLADFARRADITLCGGAGLEPASVLGRENFHLAGYFGRAVFDPAKATAQKTATLPLQLECPETSLAALPLDHLNDCLRKERRVFRRRSGALLEWLFRGPALGEFELLTAHEHTDLHAYAVLRTTAGRTGSELHVVDAACPSVDAPRLARALASIAAARKLPLYVTLFGESWTAAFSEAGFAPLRPRWPLHWILRDPRQRAMGITLLRREAWFLTAADADLDHW